MRVTWKHIGFGVAAWFLIILLRLELRSSSVREEQLRAVDKDFYITNEQTESAAVDGLEFHDLFDVAEGNSAPLEHPLSRRFGDFEPEMNPRVDVIAWQVAERETTPKDPMQDPGSEVEATRTKSYEEQSIEAAIDEDESEETEHLATLSDTASLGEDSVQNLEAEVEATETAPYKNEGMGAGRFFDDDSEVTLYSATRSETTSLGGGPLQNFVSEETTETVRSQSDAETIHAEPDTVATTSSMDAGAGIFNSGPETKTSETLASARAAVVETENKSATTTAPLSKEFRLGRVSKELRAVKKVCGKCREIECVNACRAYELLLEHLNKKATKNHEAPLTIVPVDTIAWMKSLKLRSKFKNMLREIVAEVKADSGFAASDGTGYVFLCLSYGCLKFAGDLAEAVNDAGITRAVYAGLTMTSETHRWPCPLRVISLTAAEVENVELAVKKSIAEAAPLAQAKNRATCTDRGRSDPPFDGLKEIDKVT